MNRSKAIVILARCMLALLLLAGCKSPSSNEEMGKLLRRVAADANVAANSFCPDAQQRHFDSLLRITRDPYALFDLKMSLGKALLNLGQEDKAIAVYKDLLEEGVAGGVYDDSKVLAPLALAYLRSGEKANCLLDHSAQSCLFPIAVSGVHSDKRGSQKAIELYTRILKADPHNREALWLLNIAYMTTGGYPEQVPPLYRLQLPREEATAIKPFSDVAVQLGLDKKTMAGGSIIDDFNNDGYLDVLLSGWGLDEHMTLFHNNGNGTFTDVTASSGLSPLTGGLNMLQTDYNNDGFKDVLVLRGAWKKDFGNEPNSLLRNNGDGTFTDVTVQSGLLSFHPTQTATWADFNRDGWVDLFIGNETSSDAARHPCELFINDRNGKFSNVARECHADVVGFVKGVTSGDYDNDGWMDIFISTFNGNKILLRNEGKGGKLDFKDVSAAAGLTKNLHQTFPTWFWDYNNDGWLDILVCEYQFTNSLAWYAASEVMGPANEISGRVFLFRNKGDGTFEEVTEKTGLNKVAFAMGSNFGDIDNDGYPDIFLGTGNPQYESLVPNKLFHNMGGDRFSDVTGSARVGSLQKGHAVSFADLDDDGDEDIFIKMGGAFVGDAYQNSLFLNPGQSRNHWIGLSLNGVKSNRAAIGARVKVSFREHGVRRAVYRDINSGGSFGSNPLEAHIGVGTAAIIDSIAIDWPVGGSTQVFKNIRVDQHIRIEEGVQVFSSTARRTVSFDKDALNITACAPK